MLFVCMRTKICSEVYTNPLQQIASQKKHKVTLKHFL